MINTVNKNDIPSIKHLLWKLFLIAAFVLDMILSIIAAIEDEYSKGALYGVWAIIAWLILKDAEDDD